MVSTCQCMNRALYSWEETCFPASYSLDIETLSPLPLGASCNRTTTFANRVFVEVGCMQWCNKETCQKWASSLLFYVCYFYLFRFDNPLLYCNYYTQPHPPPPHYCTATTIHKHLSTRASQEPEHYITLHYFRLFIGMALPYSILQPALYLFTLH